MKFRTDFVTNSSDSSFLTFNIRNKKLFDFLRSLGIKVSKTKKGVFTDRMIVTLPSGESTDLAIDDGLSRPYVSEFNSISAWIVGMLLWEVEQQYPHREEEDYSDFAKELIEILNNADVINLDWEMVENWSRDDLAMQLSKLDEFDESLETVELEHAHGFEGEIGPCEKISVSNGKKVTIDFSYDPWDDDDLQDEGEEVVTGDDLQRGFYDGDLFDLAEKKGITSTVVEIWKDGRWIRQYSDEEKDAQLAKNEEVKAIAKKLISENQMLRKLLIVNGQGKSIEAGDAEQIALAESITFEEMVEKGYVCFELDDNILADIENIKCKIIITENDNTIAFDVLCDRDNWMLEGYAQRPLEIACIIAKAVIGAPCGDPKGELRFVGTLIRGVTDKVALYSMLMTNSKPTFDFGEQEDDSISLMDYKNDYKTILEAIFENRENRALLLASDSDKYNRLNVLDMIASGAISLSEELEIAPETDLAAKVMLTMDYTGGFSVGVNCTIIGKVALRNLKDGADRLNLLAERVETVMTSSKGLSSFVVNEVQLNEEIAAKMMTCQFLSNGARTPK